MIGLVKNALKRLLPAPAWERFRNRWWRYVRPLTVDYCPVMLPWFPGARSNDGAAPLHRLAMNFHWKNQRSMLTSVCVWMAALLWPFRFLVDASRAFWRNSRQIKRLYGVGRWKQLAQIAQLGLGSNIPPTSFYLFRLFKPENASRASSYVLGEEMSVLYPKLALSLPPDTPLRLKDAFFEHGLMHGLPVAETVAVFANGAIHRWYSKSPNRLPACDLVIKPVDQAGGQGFQLWSYVANERTWRRGEREFDAAALIAHCCDAATHHRHILQVRLRNHPALAGLSGDGLSTIRVVTYRRPGGQSGVLLACLRMPSGASVVDNFDAGGIVAPIDLQTGMLGTAAAKDATRGEFERHPDTNAPIAGVPLPLFGDSIESTIRAHDCFPWIPFVGWDVAVTADGPILLEANPDWGVELPQLAAGVPLGDTLYPTIYFEYIAAQRQSKMAQSSPQLALVE